MSGRPRSLAAKLSWLMSNTKGPDGRPWTTRSLSEATKVAGEGMSHATIGKIREGENDNPRLRTVEALAMALGVSPGFFFSLYDEADLPAGRMFGDPRIREMLKLMSRLNDEDIADIEALVRERAEAAGEPAEEIPLTSVEQPKRPARHRSEAARRAAQSLEP